jgi:hypothetical protein
MNNGIRYWLRPFTVLQENIDRIREKLNEVIISENRRWTKIDTNMIYINDKLIPDFDELYRHIYPQRYPQRQENEQRRRRREMETEGI